jgi:predicted alpha/beta-fold hydrolase
VSLAGHAWTVVPHLLSNWSRVSDDGARPWTTEVEDPRVGRVRLSGRLFEPPGAQALLIAVHGLGGSAASSYMLKASRAAHSAGLATLRLSLRGADGSGEDVYNAALIDDLRAALASPEAVPYGTVFVLGFSLGGHLALRFATEQPDPRLRAVAAVCAPLDLASSQATIDAPGRPLYRRYLLARLRRSAAPVATRGRLPVSMRELRQVRTIREWDRLVVVPRFGFASTEDYYARSSVAPHLGRLAVPALLVVARNDPMVPAATLRPWLKTAPRIDVRWVARGGHLGFPRSLDLGERGPRGIDGQVVAWLQCHG